MTVAPSIRRLENFRMAIEIDDTRTRECWWCQNEVKRLFWKQVRILVNANTTSQNAVSLDGLSNHPERLGRVKIRGATGHPNIFKAPVTETHQFAA